MSNTSETNSVTENTTITTGDQGLPLPKGKCILVCGGRDYFDRARVYAELDRLCQHDGPLKIITGSANGADRLTADWYFERRHKNKLLEFDWFPADWKTYGKAAGPIRNQKMLAKGKPDLVIAFPGGKGTADMMTRARAAGVEVIKIPIRPTSQDATITSGETAEQRGGNGP